MTTAVDFDAAESTPAPVTVSRDDGRWRSRAIRISALVVAIAVWQIAAMIVDNPSVFPSFPKTMSALWELMQEAAFWSAVAETVRITALGELLAIVIGVPLGILIGVSRTADTFLS